MEFAHWVNGGQYPAALFTDHRNLLALFDDRARPISCTGPNRSRLTRWGLSLLGLRYEIYHISGEENHLADLGSRWGNRFTPPPPGISNPAMQSGLAGGPKLLLRAAASGAKKIAPGRKVMLRTPYPKVTNETRDRDMDLAVAL